MRFIGLASAAVVALLVGVGAGAVKAQDPFEIQVYDANTAEPGAVGAELHVNHFFDGTSHVPAGDVATEHLTHFAFEPHVGIASWCEAGMYLQSALRADGGFDYAGVKLRFKARVPHRVWDLLGLSLNTEVAVVPRAYEPDRLEWELRPIVDLDWRRLYVAFNPIVAVPLRGQDAARPHFEPALKASVRVLDFMAVGAEYYAALGAFADFAPSGEQVHRLFGALDFEWRSGSLEYELNVGFGHGFMGLERWIAKVIFEVDLEPDSEPPAAPSREATHGTGA